MAIEKFVILSNTVVFLKLTLLILGSKLLTNF